LFQAYLDKRFEKTYFKDVLGCIAQFQQQFQLDAARDIDQNFANKWDAISRYLGGVLNLLRDIYLSPDENWKAVIPWLGEHLGVPKSVQYQITQHSSIFNKAGTPEFSHILAYHYLEQFKHEGNTASATPLNVILNPLNSQLLPSILFLDTPEKRQIYVEDELALKIDTVRCLQESLVLSWDIQSVMSFKDPLAVVEAKKKSGSHRRICSLCNRIIPQ
jgi:hypothetical protein